LTKKQSKPVCETIGVNAMFLRDAIDAWHSVRERTKIGYGLLKTKRLVKSAMAVSYVASLPPPPVYGTPEYQRCIQYWYQCYMQASYLDSYRVQAAQMQQQITNGEINLTGYLSGYAQCIGGFPV
jgi:hypothetical protein